MRVAQTRTSSRGAQPAATRGRCEPGRHGPRTKSPPSTGRTGAPARPSRTGPERSGRARGSASTRVVPRTVPDRGRSSLESRRRLEGTPDDRGRLRTASAPRRPRRARPRGHRAVARRQGLPTQPRRDRGRAEVDVLRGPADRQRHARHPPRRGARLQGRLPPLQDHEGLLRPPDGRLGLPRPAGRARRREGTRLHRQARHRGVRHRRVQRPVPRERPAPRRRVRADVASGWATGPTTSTPTGR